MQIHNSQIYQYLLKFLPRRGMILEAGCGDGKHVYRLANHGYNVIGIDKSPYVIETALAKMKFYCHNKIIDERTGLLRGDIFILPFRDCTISAYLSFGVIEHYSKNQQTNLIQEIFRVLDSKGIVLVTVPNRISIWPLFRWCYSHFNIGQYSWQASMTKETLKKKFLNNGFELIYWGNFDIWTSFNRSFYLNKKRLKNIFPNPLFFLNKFFKFIAELSEKYIPLIGYNSIFIGQKKDKKIVMR